MESMPKHAVMTRDHNTMVACDAPSNANLLLWITSTIKHVVAAFNPPANTDIVAANSPETSNPETPACSEWAK